MKHPDEHTLELYVVGSRKVLTQRGRIEAHISACQRCHALVQRIGEFYQAVDRTVESPISTQGDHSTALSRRSVTIQAGDSPWAPPKPPAHPAIRRVYTYAKSHPIVAGAGTMGLIGLAALLVISGIERLNRDLNPDHVQYGAKEGALVVFNSRDEIVWQKPTLMAAAEITKSGEPRGSQYAVVADLDMDGKNEVVSTLPFRGLDLEGPPAYKVRVFSHRKDLLSATPIGRAVRFGSSEYLANYGSAAILILDDSTNQRKEILVGGGNFWSPYVLMRLSNHGDVKGEYWHYGHATPMYLVKGVGPKKTDCVLLLAQNDARDSVGSLFPAVIVIDPWKIVGVTESSLTRGFGFDRSDAEVFYICLPQPDICVALNQTMHASRLTGNDQESLACLFDSSPEVFALEYTFSRDMALRAIKPTSGFEALYARLLREGKIHSRLDKDYFERLKAEVRYWDGKKWGREVGMVQK